MDTTTAITVAGIGLAGVLIGGIITAVANFILAVRREHAEEQTRQRAAKTEIVTASRLILAELFTIQSVVTTALSKQKQVGAYPPLEISSWKEYKSVLAAVLSIDAWNNMAIAYNAINLLIATIAMPDDPPSDQTDFFKSLIKTIEAATAGLQPHIKRT